MLSFGPVVDLHRTIIHAWLANVGERNRNWRGGSRLLLAIFRQTATSFGPSALLSHFVSPLHHCPRAFVSSRFTISTRSNNCSGPLLAFFLALPDAIPGNCRIPLRHRGAFIFFPVSTTPQSSSGRRMVAGRKAHHPQIARQLARRRRTLCASNGCSFEEALSPSFFGLRAA